MRYKVKDKVIIKKKCWYASSLQKILNNNNHILTIKKVKKKKHNATDKSYIEEFHIEEFYIMEETECTEWYEIYIEGLYIKPEPIISRFEILDL